MSPRNRFGARASVLALLVLSGIVAGGGGVMGCGGSDAPHGAPVLLEVRWEGWNMSPTTAPTLVWSKDPAAASNVAASAPPGARRVDFIFDRVLDGSKIEAVPEGGTSLAPVADPPLSISWADTDAGSQVPFKVDVWYNSIPLAASAFQAAPGTSYLFAQETPSFPSSTSLTIEFHHDRITSKYAEPMVEPDAITVMTDPFTLTAASPASMVLVNYWVPLQFNTLPAALGDLAPYVHVATGGASLKFQLAPEPLDPRLIYVQPAPGEIWPSGSAVDVTVDAELPDRYGATLATPAKVSFLPCRTTGDKGSACPPPLDAGASGGDAASPDGGAGPADAADDTAGDGAADAAAAVD